VLPLGFPRRALAANEEAIGEARRLAHQSREQVALLRAVEQPKCSALILEEPPPQTPQRISPESR
jgi:hypothetical protein